MSNIMPGYLLETEYKENPNTFVFGFGSPCWTRTNDLRINSPSLYRLS